MPQYCKSLSGVAVYLRQCDAQKTLRARLRARIEASVPACGSRRQPDHADIEI